MGVQIVDSVAVLALANPPVNGLGLAVRRALLQSLTEARRDPLVRAIVLLGDGRGFSAGGDIRELGTPASSAAPGLSADVHPAIERGDKPVIAAMHGFAIGGGLETALACHYRIARSNTRLSLPEVQLGILPLSGTQRLPRVLSLSATLELIVGGRRIDAGELRGTLMIDRILDDGDTDLTSSAVAFAQEILERAVHPLIRDRAPVTVAPTEQLAAARERHAGGPAAVRAAIEAIAAAYESPDFESGLLRARALYDSLERSGDTRAARDRFLQTGPAAERGRPL